MEKYAHTHAALAAELGCSRPVIGELARMPDAPKKTQKGYVCEQWRAHAEKHSRGPYRKGSGGTAATVNGLTLADVRIRDTYEHSENQRIAKERQQVAQAKELGRLVDVEDVIKFNGQIIATFIALLNGAAAAMDRAIPEGVQGAARDRILDVVRKLQTDGFTVLSELNGLSPGNSTKHGPTKLAKPARRARKNA